ncbi:MAG: pyruvate kinase [Phycisphaerales bacterium]|nr:pyruvate kinase [Phycisphaerales bacterium]
MGDFNPRTDPEAEHFRTAIIATLGPASWDEPVLEQLIKAGANIFRLNFSHGDEAGHERTLARIRTVASRLGVPIGVLGDLPGPKIRLTEVPGGGFLLEPGQRIEFHRGLASALHGEDGTACLGCTLESIIDDVQVGHHVLIDDGLVRLVAIERGDDMLVCEVEVAGRISSHKGVNLPDTDLDIEMPTDRDRRFAAWAIEHDLDWVAMSFVRSAEDVQSLEAHMRSVAGTQNRPIPIIAKMEVPRAIEHAASIVQEVDAMMVARGDLGVEMDLALVPSIQKHLLAVTRDARIPCIVATQMLQSMIESPVPTRAEASDVANAIFDGADAVMLSGETAVGTWPVEAVSTMHRISCISESTMRSLSISTGGDLEPIADVAPGPLESLVDATWTAALSANARCIVVPSSSGLHARHLSRNEFQLPVLALADDPRAVRRMLLLRGVTPVQVDALPDPAHLVERAESEVLALGWAEAGEMIIIVARDDLVDSGARMIVHRMCGEAGD